MMMMMTIHHRHNILVKRIYRAAITSCPVNRLTFSRVTSWIIFWRSNQSEQQHCHLSPQYKRRTGNIFQPPLSTPPTATIRIPVWKPLNRKNLKSVQKAFMKPGEWLGDLWAGKLSIEVNLKKLVEYLFNLTLTSRCSCEIKPASDQWWRTASINTKQSRPRQSIYCYGN